MSNRYLVTGGAGFIGSHIVRRLVADGARVRVVDNLSTGLPERLVFELNEGEHHAHIVCTDCGRVEEFTDDSIEEKQREIAARLGFEISDHSLTFHGRCVRPNCPHRAKQS